MIQEPRKREFPSSGNNPRSLTVSAMSRKLATAKKRYIRWLNKNHPNLLKRALDEAGLSKKDVGLSGMGQAANPAGPGQDSGGSGGSGGDKAWYDQILDFVPTAIQSYGAYEQQKNLIEINEQRARQGLDPLNSPPAIRVEGEAGPETRRAVQEGIMGAAGQYLPYIAGGIGLFLLMNSRQRKK